MKNIYKNLLIVSMAVAISVIAQPYFRDFTLQFLSKETLERKLEECNTDYLNSTYEERDNYQAECEKVLNAMIRKAVSELKSTNYNNRYVPNLDIG